MSALPLFDQFCFTALFYPNVTVHALSGTPTDIYNVTQSSAPGAQVSWTCSGQGGKSFPCFAPIFHPPNAFSMGIARLIKKLRTDFNEIFWNGIAWPKDQVIRFWWR